jgi:hypothetical protein
MKLPPSLLAFACGVMLSTPAFAQEQSLFNGKDLSGWDGNTALWSVKDGVIHGETTASPENAKKSTLRHNTFLVWTGGKVGDFELHAKFRMPSDWGNSGIQYRSEVRSVGPDGPIVAGYQADMETGKTYSGILYEEKGRGILAKRGEQTLIKANPNDSAKHLVEVTGSVGVSQEIQDAIHIAEWNDYVIIAKGNHLEHFINGKKTIDVTDEHETGAKEGVLALQMHAGAPMIVEFKDITLKPLK